MIFYYELPSLSVIKGVIRDRIILRVIVAISITLRNKLKRETKRKVFHINQSVLCILK